MMSQDPAALSKISPQALLEFSRTLAGLPPTEIQKLKVLYVRNTIVELKAQIQTMEALYTGCMGWMFLFMRPFTMKQLSIQRQRARELVRNMLDVWKDDLVGEDIDTFFLVDR